MTIQETLNKLQNKVVDYATALAGVEAAKKTGKFVVVSGGLKGVSGFIYTR